MTFVFNLNWSLWNQFLLFCIQEIFATIAQPEYHRQLSQDKDPNLLKSRTTNKRAGAKLRAGLTESPIMFKPTRIIKVKLKTDHKTSDLAITFGS